MKINQTTRYHTPEDSCLHVYILYAMLKQKKKLELQTVIQKPKVHIPQDKQQVVTETGSLSESQAIETALKFFKGNY